MAKESGKVDEHTWQKLVDDFLEFMWQMLAILSRVFLAVHEVIESAIRGGRPSTALPTFDGARHPPGRDKGGVVNTPPCAKEPSVPPPR